MRVISGHFKGQRLVSFKGDHLRPTTDFVKESIFNRLALEISDSRVLDLFSGTGSLSIEALSRGASEIVALEKKYSFTANYHANLEHLKIPAHISHKLSTSKDHPSTEKNNKENNEENKLGRIRVIKDDVLKFLGSYTGAPFDIILVDPPFTQKMAHTVMLSLAQSQVVNKKSCIAIESCGTEHLEKSYGVFDLSVQKDYGDKKLSFLSM